MIAKPENADLFNVLPNGLLNQFKDPARQNALMGEVHHGFLTEATVIACDIALGKIEDADQLNERQKFMLCAAGGVPYEAVAELGDESKGEKSGKLAFRLKKIVGLIVKDRRMNITILGDAEKGTP